MAIFLSPGVYIQEKDFSDIIPRVATASAALVGYSAKGSVDNIMLITSNQQFLAEYGQPDPSSGHYFHYAALAYLAQGNTLYCLRVANGVLRGGVDIMDSLSGEDNRTFTVGMSSAEFDAPSGYGDDILFQIMGVNPGAWNNKIGIKITEVKDGSDLVPTDQYTFKIVVYSQNDDGAWELVETWKVSRKNKLDGYGKQLYLEDKINGASKYIVVADNPSSDMIDTKLPQPQEERLDFTKGSDGSEISSSELVLGWDEFKDSENVDVRILINGGETEKAVQSEMKEIAESRADCIAILDMPYDQLTSVTSMVNWRQLTQNFNSSYCALYTGWVQIYDPYNDMLIDVPPSGHVAAQVAYNDYVANPWDAPAGYSRGSLNIIKTSIIFSKGDRDTLYEAQINPIQMFRGEGIAIWGQKTEQTKSSALSRVNVRRLLIVIEKSIAIALRSFVFEPNSEITRFRVEAMLNDWLDRLSAQGAFQLEGGDKGFHVVCDETNNPPATIDDNELHVDIFVKPVRVAEYIRLQTIVTSTGASFNELISRGMF